MIKILFFIPGLSEGGAEKVLRTLVNHMDQTKFDITVQTIDKEDPSKYLVEGIHYKAINTCKSKIGKKLFSYWFRFCAEFKLAYPLYIKDDYDIEVAYLECCATKILSSSTNKKAKKLAWVHCDLTKKDGFVQNVDRIKKYYTQYDNVIYVSDEVKQSYESLFGTSPEAVVLYNVNDDKEIILKSKEFSVPKENTNIPRIVSVGRLTYQKSFDRLIEVCKQLKERNYLFETLILGEGEDRENLKKMIIEYGLQDHVKLIGFVENPYPYIASADIMVCTSRYEGFSTVMTESLILGKAIVTTPCAGMKELLGDSEYGVITEDHVEGIFTGISQLLNSIEKKEFYEKAAQYRGREFSCEELVAKTENFFINSLLNEKMVSN